MWESSQHVLRLLDRCGTHATFCGNQSLSHEPVVPHLNHWGSPGRFPFSVMVLIWLSPVNTMWG